ncbi:ATP-binding protein [bacterium]|nr:ATP-binding protein [bacterium]MBU1614388.1 ATP-binding protein [bacterium]
MKHEFPQEISSNFEGYRGLIDFYNKTSALAFDRIILDFAKTTWLEANLIAVLGAILNKVQSGLNEVKIENLSSNIRNVLSRNHFLSHFGGLKIPDYYKTTIKYRKFKRAEEKLFKEYLDGELLSKEAMPDMSSLLRKKINESIFEIFNNAVIHGNCSHIFSCGQYYPQKKRLDFTIVDLGKTIKANVTGYVNRNLSGKDSIKWAVAEGHTTKQGQIPGGLGLSLIREFLEKNNGKIQIISSDGYWEQEGQGKRDGSFPQTFSGTIVNLEFNIDDKSHYCLLSEIDKDNIF